MGLKPWIVTIPHSGEQIPPEIDWLQNLSEPHLMCDVDRYVDQLYQRAIVEMEIPHVICPWHRYFVDLNRLATDVDEESVTGSVNARGQFTMGLHWVKTTTGLPLMKHPIPQDLHQRIVTQYFEPFHHQVVGVYQKLKKAGFQETYHLDLHSMPSWGTSSHRDPGEQRAEVVISDFNGKSCASDFKDLVIEAYQKAGFTFKYNWPYIGGRLTQQYGFPDRGQHAIQIELRRDLYMDEVTKRKKSDTTEIEERLNVALSWIGRHI